MKTKLRRYVLAGLIGFFLSFIVLWFCDGFSYAGGAWLSEFPNIDSPERKMSAADRGKVQELILHGANLQILLFALNEGLYVAVAGFLFGVALLYAFDKVSSKNKSAHFQSKD